MPGEGWIVRLRRKTSFLATPMGNRPILPISVRAKGPTIPTRNLIPKKFVASIFYMMNPMAFIGDTTRPTAAKYLYIRQGAKDREPSFLVPINLATKLRNAGCGVNFVLPWNRTRGGDYNLDDIFEFFIAKMSQ